MSRFLRYEACPKCVDRGKDSRGDNLAVYSDGGRHCFSCGHHEHPPSSNRWARPVDEDKNNKIKRILPDDFTTDVPARAWQWLLQYGLPYDYWRPIVGWSERHQRLVFRVGEPLRFSQGRLFPREGSVVDGRKWHVWGDSHSSVETFGQGGSITLVEDLLSAHKVGQVNQAVCLFGTTIYPAHILYLRKRGLPIHLWLDGDQRGLVEKKATNINILTGLPVNIILTENDPKGYNNDQIQEYLNRSSF